MRLDKIVKDWLFKAYLTSHRSVPSGLVDMQKYFRNYGAIVFNLHKEDGMWVAVSENFRFGSIVTFAASEEALDGKIQDAILTSFGIPSSYAKEAGIHRQGNQNVMTYAAA